MSTITFRLNQSKRQWKRSRVIGSLCGCRYGALPASAGKGLTDKPSVLPNFYSHLLGAKAASTGAIAVCESKPVKIDRACHRIAFPYLDDLLYHEKNFFVNTRIKETLD